MITTEQENLVRQEKNCPTKSHAKKTAQANKKNNNPTAVELSQLINDFNQGLLVEAKMRAIKLTQIFPNHGMAWKVLGVIHHHEQSMEKAGEALKTAAALMPKDAEVHYNLANFYCDSNQLEAAKAGYQKAIKLAPGLAKAHFNLAHVLKDLKQFTSAETSYRKGLKLEPQQAKMHFYLGLCLYAQERFKDALKSFQKSLKLSENDVDVYLHLGICHRALGNLTKAEEYCRKALRIDSQDADIYNQLAIILNEQGRQQEAETAYLKAIELDTNHVAAHQNLGLFYRDRDKPKEAEACLRKALSIREPTAEALNNMAAILTGQNRYVEAEIYCRQALALTSTISDIWNNFGVILLARMKIGEAQEAFEQALAIQPNNVRTLSNYSETLRLAGKPSQTEVYSKKAIELDNSHVDAYLSLGNAYHDQGLIENAIEILKQSLVLAPEQLSIYSNFLYSTTCSEKFAPESHLALAREYGRIVSKKAEQKFDTWLVNPQDQYLRVGVVSGDLRRHPVAYFLKNVIQHIDSSKIALVAYLTDGRVDSVSAELKPYFTQWKSLVGHDHRSAAEMIHADGIHVLLDLSGHTAGNKLPIFAWRPAPAQATWLGYWSTTGVAEIDYCLTDEVSLPLSCQIQFSEKIKYLPDTRLCFSEPEIAMEIAQLPAIKNGYVTLGCYQQLAKVGNAVMELWGKVMQAIPSARLRWQCKSFTDEAIIAEVKQRLQRSGVDIERISLLEQVSREAYFASYAEVDMNLDTFPFTGGTTTCDALWMGVPTLTLIGNTMIARQGASLMTAAGLSDWVAANQTEYIEKVIAFSANLTGLATLRSGLRARLKTSPLFDGARFAGHFETALQELWQEKCAILAKKFINTAQSSPDEQNPTQNRSQQDVAVIIEIVSATRMNEQDFWQHSALGQSLVTQLIQNSNLSVNVTFENTRGLSEVFNAAIAQADDEAILVFIHDDVWIDDAQFTQAVLAGLNKFDIIGVAGNKRRLPKQPAWAFIDTQFTWDTQENLSGKVAHGETAQGKISEYGDVPAECELLDGVFLAAKKQTLVTQQVRFDPQFDFHFYDLDFCRSARLADLTLGTWPIQLTHQSGGAFGSASWQEKYQQYLRKWEFTQPGASDYASSINQENALLPMQLRIALVIQHSIHWTVLRSVCHAFSELSQVVVKVIKTPFIRPGVADGYYEEIDDLLSRDGVSVDDRGSYAIAEFNPHLIFLPSPYETTRIKELRADTLIKQGYRIAYIPYGIEMGGGDNNIFAQFNTAVQCLAWRVFVRSERSKAMYKKYCAAGNLHVVVTGHPKFDNQQNLDSYPISYALKKKIADRPVILWTPHFTVGLPASWSTYCIYNEIIMQQVGLRQDIFIIVRPHPLFFKEMLSQQVWQKEDEQQFRDLCRSQNNLWLDENSDYIEVFSASNGIMADAGSFLLEYLPTKKPILYLHHPEGFGLNDDADLVEHYYQAKEPQHIVNFIEMISKCDDPMRARRLGITSEYLYGLDGKVGERIAHHVLNDLTSELIQEQRLRETNAHAITKSKQSMEEALQDALTLAIECQNTGWTDKAQVLYHEILKVVPAHAEANHHLGIIEIYTRGVEYALPRFEMAIQSAPDNERYWVGYIDLLMMEGLADQASAAVALGKQYGLTEKTARMLTNKIEKTTDSKQIKNNLQFQVNSYKPPGQFRIITLIPAYKTKYIEPLLLSLATQTYQYFKIIVSDDNPNEDVAALICRLKQQDIYKRLDIEIVTGPKKGGFVNIYHIVRNFAQKAEFFHILLDDDLVYPTFYETHMREHAAKDALVSVSARWNALETGQPYGMLIDHATSTIFSQQFDAATIANKLIPTCSNKLGEFSHAVFRREAAEVILNPSMQGVSYFGLDDIGSFIQAAQHKPAIWIPTPLGIFRNNPEQNTGKLNNNTIKCGHYAWIALAIIAVENRWISADEAWASISMMRNAVRVRYQHDALGQQMLAVLDAHEAYSESLKQGFLNVWNTHLTQLNLEKIVAGNLTIPIL